MNDITENPMTIEPLYGKDEVVIGAIATILKPEHDRKYVVVWKPGDKYYGKVRFTNASLSMPEGKLEFLRKKYELDRRLSEYYDTLVEVA